MRTRSQIASCVALIAPLVLSAATPFHIELTASSPEADQVLEASPAEIWLQFSVVPDMEQTSFSVRGSDGNVELEDIEVGEDPTLIKAEVSTPIAAGEYTVSWVGGGGPGRPPGTWTLHVFDRGGPVGRTTLV